MKLNIKTLTNTRFSNTRIYNAVKTNGSSELFAILDYNKLNIFAI